MPKMPPAKESLSLTQPQLLTQELCRSDPGSDDRSSFFLPPQTHRAANVAHLRLHITMEQ